MATKKVQSAQPQQQQPTHLIVDGKLVDRETLNRVMSAKPQRNNAPGSFQPKPFSVLK